MFIADHFGTQKQMAKVLGITPQWAIILRKEPEKIKLREMRKLALHTGVPICDVLTMLEAEVKEVSHDWAATTHDGE